MEDIPQNKSQQLNWFYRSAVLIFSTISAFTTALGAQDLFGLPMAVALAVGLSVLLIAIAFNLPEAYAHGRQNRLLLGYIFIALISILFNFNYIYGKFSAEDLLYTELARKRDAIDEVRVRAERLMDDKLQLSKLAEDINRYQQVMEREERLHPDASERGKGPRWQQAAMNKRQAEEDMNTRRATNQSYYERIDESVEAMKGQIGSSLESSDVTAYRGAIEFTVTENNELRNYILTEFPEMDIPAMTFENKDIGKLNHTLWSFSQFSQLTGKQKSSFVVALVVSFVIDFAVLFVLAIVSSTGAHNRSVGGLTTYAADNVGRKKFVKKSDKDLFHNN